MYVPLTMIVINPTLAVSLTVPNFKRLVDVACGKREDTGCMVFTGKMQTPQIHAGLDFLVRFANAFFDRCAPNKYPVSKDYKTGQNCSSIRHIDRSNSRFLRDHHPLTSRVFKVPISRSIHHVIQYFCDTVRAWNGSEPESFQARLEEKRACLYVIHTLYYITE